MFNNNGLAIGGVDERAISGDVIFIADPRKQYVHPNFAVPSGQVDIFVKDFKYPQVFRMNVALDKKFKNGIVGSLEGMYTKTLNNIVYTNVNSDPTVNFTWAGRDNRPVYTLSSLDRTYSAIYAGHNTSKGYTYNFTASMAKQFHSGLDAFLAWTYGDAEAVNEGTSSQNSSQWRGQVSIDGRNNPVLGRSDYSLGHRVVGGLSYKLKWNQSETVATHFSLFYEGQSGNAFSYIIAGRNGQNANNETGSTSRNRSLPYMPSSSSDIVLITKDGMSPAQQWELLNKFIECSPLIFGRNTFFSCE